MGTLANSKHLAQAKVADAKDMASASVAVLLPPGWMGESCLKVFNHTKCPNGCGGNGVCMLGDAVTQVSLADHQPCQMSREERWL